MIPKKPVLNDTGSRTWHFIVPTLCVEMLCNRSGGAKRDAERPGYAPTLERGSDEISGKLQL